MSSGKETDRAYSTTSGSHMGLYRVHVFKLSTLLECKTFDSANGNYYAINHWPSLATIKVVTKIFCNVQNLSRQLYPM